jgi:hypothetical protein
MARSQTLRLGKGARCSVLVKNLRPSCEIKERILNPLLRQRVTDLVVRRRAIITNGRSTYEAIYFTSATFPNLDLHSARRFTVVDAEGHPNRVYTTITTPVEPDAEREIDPSIFNATDTLEDIARVCAEGFEVDDDNEALPENRPALDAPPIEVSADGLLRGQEWGWDGLDQRVLKGGDTKTHRSRTDGRPLTRPTSTSSFDSSRLRGSRIFFCRRLRLRWRPKKGITTQLVFNV